MRSGPVSLMKRAKPRLLRIRAPTPGAASKELGHASHTSGTEVASARRPTREPERHGVPQTRLQLIRVLPTRVASEAARAFPVRPGQAIAAA